MVLQVYSSRHKKNETVRQGITRTINVHRSVDGIIIVINICSVRRTYIYVDNANPGKGPARNESEQMKDGPPSCSFQRSTLLKEA